MPAVLTPPPAPPEEQAPRRFQVAKRTLLVDGFMTHFIKIGGVLVVTVVLGIFFFILSQVIPLFRSAQVQEIQSFPLEQKEYRTIGVDEWSELPFVVEPDGALSFYDLKGNRGKQLADVGFTEQREITTVRYRPYGQRLIYGTADGRFSVVNVNYSMVFEDGKQQVVHAAKAGPYYPIGPEGGRVVAIGYGDSGSAKLAAAIVEVNGARQIHTASLAQKRTLLGAGAIEVGDTSELTQHVRGTPEHIQVNGHADGILVTTAEGEVFYFFLGSDGISLRQTFSPFADEPDRSVAAINFILGDVSVVVTNRSGKSRIYSMFVPHGGSERLWGRTKEFPPLPKAPEFYSTSLRNKSFLIGAGNFASLRHSTTEAVRWESLLPFEVEHAVLSGKQDRILFLDKEHRFHVYSVNDPHPEASIRGLFGKLWYEGAPEPRYEWQSTGGTDDFEPKLSLIPLIIGTFKGTLYAMVFALPIALLAAIYTSQFLEPKVKRVVKPVMEIMASLPSVVLGFIAALWLAPLLETRVPSIITMIVLVPSAAWLFGWFWSGLPYRTRRIIRPGYELVIFVPILIAVGWLGWTVGPAVERLLFTITDPVTGERISDFRRWWPAVTGADFQQRNSLVVGFIMGFAVIPIIFTITEDSLSNVPGSLTTGSLALGASRWQTALYVVLPTASAGIFSAVMIGLGRAIGETMIVVMATGNTPIMDLNIFSGMRTLSANIAVELPEAPHHSTLYRTLFLGAMVLFILTFAVNTLAEVMRQRLREKYKMV